MAIYPWQAPQWTQLARAWEAKRLHHAILLRGPAGRGKLEFGRHLANTLLCENKQQGFQPCGACRGCHQFGVDAHPDYKPVGLLEDKRNIGIEQIRETISSLSLTPQYGDIKVALVAPADAMTRGAANSLLKTLEEPAGNSIFVLVADRIGLLPVTVRSRCLSLDFLQGDKQAALNWLQESLPGAVDADLLLALARGAPLLAKKLGESDELSLRATLLDDLGRLTKDGADPVDIAKQWMNAELDGLLNWLQALTVDLIRTRLYQHDALTNRDMAASLQALAEKLDLERLFQLYDHSTDLQRAVAHRANFNHQLMLEDLAIAWAVGVPSRK